MHRVYGWQNEVDTDEFAVSDSCDRKLCVCHNRLHSTFDEDCMMYSVH